MLALTNVRSLTEDGIMDRVLVIRMGEPMNVHKCDGHGKVDRALVKSMFKREMCDHFVGDAANVSANACQQPEGETWAVVTSHL